MKTHPFKRTVQIAFAGMALSVVGSLLAATSAESAGIALYTGAVRTPSVAISVDSRILTYAPSAPTSLVSTPTGCLILVR